LRQRVAKTHRNRGYRDQRDHGKAERAEAIHSVFSKIVFNASAWPRAPVHGGETAGILTREAGFRPMTDASWATFARKDRHRFTTLANPALFAI
jgi:hypothetical protein